jgi:hypothetical protein
MPGKPENRESMQKGESNKGKHEKETVKEDMSVGSSDGNGIRFGVPNHPDKSVVRPGGA